MTASFVSHNFESKVSPPPLRLRPVRAELLEEEELATLTSQGEDTDFVDDDLVDQLPLDELLKPAEDAKPKAHFVVKMLALGFDAAPAWQAFGAARATAVGIKSELREQVHCQWR